jgi:hypothetical protein
MVIKMSFKFDIDLSSVVETYKLKKIVNEIPKQIMEQINKKKLTFSCEIGFEDIEDEPIEDEEIEDGETEEEDDD